LNIYETIAFCILHFENLLNLTPTISYMVPDGQGQDIIMGLTSLLLLGPFYYVSFYWGLQNYETHCTKAKE
jgi:hypothetical protein